MAKASVKKQIKQVKQRALKPEARWKKRNREMYAPPKQEVLPPYRPYNPGQFRPGEAVAQGAGRPPGSIDKIPRILKELIMLAAELEGADGAGTDGALGLIRKIAREDLKTFAGLLRSIIPLQVERGESKENNVYRSVEEVRAELDDRGISMEALQQLMIEQDDEPTGEG